MSKSIIEDKLLIEFNMRVIYCGKCLYSRFELKHIFLSITPAPSLFSLFAH